MPLFHAVSFWVSSAYFDFFLFSVDLLALLNWKAHPDRVLDILGRLRQTSGEEIVKVIISVTLALLSSVFLTICEEHLFYYPIMILFCLFAKYCVVVIKE